MTSTRWRLIEDIFHAAMERSAEDRVDYIEYACSGDAELIREVKSLLGHEPEFGRVLESVVTDAVRKLPSALGQYAGRQVGPYELIREINRGGMGVVYLAIRNDQHYLQTVAIKFLRFGFDSAEMVRRFLHERQILANLSHPNIAAILDGGSTAEGLPYIVMEHIEGEPITEYCGKHRLSVRERLMLFRQVCSAVHHAHQKLVIHRDIKPGNILVTPDGTPKLLDFGIAKLLVPELVPGEPPMTDSAHRMMTPDYASPEQVMGELLGTGSDIYSLGVVLFELLTETRPYSTTGLSSREVERIVCRESTVKPSDLPSLPRRVAKELRGDLETIVLMAMHKDPNRRYASAGMFAMDLSRYLGGHVVAARPDTRAYRTAKFLRRHRAMLGAVAALMIAVLAGAITTMWQARKAERHFTQLRTLVESVLFNLNDRIGNLPQSTEIRSVLIKSTIDYLDSLTKEADADPKLLLEISRAYIKVAEIQGSPFVANLGLEDQALRSYEKALRLAQQAATQTRSDAASQLLIETRHSLARMQLHVGKTEEARRNAREALRLAKAFQAARPADTSRAQLLAVAYNDLGSVKVTAGEVDEALPDFRAALAAIKLVHNESSERLAARVYSNFGDALARTGPLPAALDALRSSVKINERVARDHAPNPQYQRELLVSYLNLGKVLGGVTNPNVGDVQAASMYFSKMREIAERLARLDNKNSQARIDLGFAYRWTGTGELATHPDAAVEWYSKAIAITREALSRAPDSVNLRWQNAARSLELAEALRRARQTREAISEAQIARDTLIGLGASEPRREFRRLMLASHCMLADLNHQLGSGASAVSYQKSAMDMLSSVRSGEPDLYVDQTLAGCYDVFSRVDPGRAADWRNQSREIRARMAAKGAYILPAN
ncbi:MAG: serine/threonine protein kinase [Bryobacterales bacterium]|nr:serine/threonine protein kinase [Bryobacterales bacterium]